MDHADERHRRRGSDPQPNLALMMIGKALAQAYRPSADQPLPETLARIVKELARREERPR
jgi:hypothetical protein